MMQIHWPLYLYFPKAAEARNQEIDMPEAINSQCKLLDTIQATSSLIKMLRESSKMRNDT